ncbi:unnamed protein product [Anisakis simplex]|uniref:Exocyst complex component 6 n=1 Tax=Anisakis simplex TaxID=6269 RepID=A0A0M3J4T7_ANISI|nr:unnamed protein product [Anisakis simplex]
MKSKFRIASFIDRLEDCISTDSAFANLVMSSSHPNLRCLLRLYDEVCAEASQLFHLLISSADNAKETSVMKLQEVLVYESFIFYYNLLYPINETLTKIFSSESDSQDMPLYLNDALNEISSKRTKVIIERLNSRGLMTQLGCPADDEVRSAMNEIGELLPHFSPQFIHVNYYHSVESTET